MDGSRVSSGAVLANPGSDWKLVNSGDFNGDGRAEVLIQHTTGQVATWSLSSDGLSISSGRVVRKRSSRSGHRRSHGDGTSDIVLQRAMALSLLGR
jgi:hypothetical protein